MIKLLGRPTVPVDRVLEPIGVASLLALLVMIFPASALSTMLARALNRARLAAILVGLAIAGALAWAVIFIAIEYWSMK